MRLIIAMVLAGALALTGACDKKTKPTAPKPAVTTSTVELCLDDLTLIRQEDARCEEGLNTFHWVWVTDSDAWPAELPAVGEFIQGGRFTTIQPSDPSIGRIPHEGGRFTGP